MMTSRSTLYAVAATLGTLLVAAQPASAQTPQMLNVKLGLWEATTSSQTSGELPFDTSKLTPEQKAKMEAAMKTMMQEVSKPHTLHTCLTKEKLEKDLPFEGKSKDNCTNTFVTRSTTVYDIKFECKGSDGETTNGEWRFQALNPESVVGGGTVNFTRGGKAMSAKTTMTSKWLGAACGDVK